jgi:hypothetical protein
MSRANSIADFLALRRNTTLLLVALVLAGTGERLWLGFAPKYLESLGATVWAVFQWFMAEPKAEAGGSAASANANVSFFGVASPSIPSCGR